jgi:acyl-lipid omega-6 desaturase (Delta-12 desaturase)
MNSNKNIAKDEQNWQEGIIKYARPDLKKSIWQIINSVVPFLFIWYLMYRSLAYPYWVTILLSFLATGFLIRVFIIFHDCGHMSFFKSKKANKIIGMIMGILVFTPYHKWHQQHKVHHQTSANLDKRGIGDVWTMTVDEYKEATPKQRFFYKAFRNPWFMFTIGPLFVVFITNRSTYKRMSRPEKQNVYFTNIVLLAITVLMSLLIGFKAFMMIMLPVLLISHSIGIWLFFIQHQFEDVIWERESRWNYKMSAMEGSSFLKLPKIFQWFTGNIGFHHVHHLSSKIPNYNLEKCHYEMDMFKDVRPIILLATFKALKLALWDEANRTMVTFRSIKEELMVPQAQVQKA